MAQTKAIKAQNNEIYNLFKQTSIQCINYSDKLSQVLKDGDEKNTRLQFVILIGAHGMVIGTL